MLTALNDEVSDTLERFVMSPAAAEKPTACNIVERVRAYSTAETMRRAREAVLPERNALERVYRRRSGSRCCRTCASRARGGFRKR